ncbi:hypothetical protein [Burkholderia sp. IMCC1007]|uniref:hypothetical protein n=1 Tax=Burkholderia sp. IMCC1007 TaxID=3004104 RepID=UPI0022B42F6A|nr:hypothetical protein [Burkholderia sp. IMCC1007]
MTETSIVEGIVQCCENAGNSNPPPLINGDAKCQWRIIRKRRSTDYVKVIMVYCPLCVFRISINLPVKNGRARVVLN